MDGDVADAPVRDVQILDISCVDDKIAKIPTATNNAVGVVSGGNKGVVVTSSQATPGQLMISPATLGIMKNPGGFQNSIYLPITASHEHEATFYGLAKAAGDTTQSASSNAVGTYTDSAKSAISQMLNSPVTITGSTPTITALPGVRYVCGECATLDITLPESGIVDVTFTSGSTPTVLTITPPTGQTVKWANGFDPTALDADTTYEINIADGLGVAGSWT